jgi:hypothetical protein
MDLAYKKQNILHAQQQQHCSERISSMQRVAPVGFRLAVVCGLARCSKDLG